MFLYFRLTLALVLIPVVFYVGLALRNEVACFGGDAVENIKTIQAEYGERLSRRNGGETSRYAHAECVAAGPREVEGLTQTTGAHYVSCNFISGTTVLEQSVFVLSRCWYVKEEVYPLADF
jgi:hypothetical protein